MEMTKQKKTADKSMDTSPRSMHARPFQSGRTTQESWWGKKPAWLLSWLVWVEKRLQNSTFNTHSLAHSKTEPPPPLSFLAVVVVEVVVVVV